MRTHKIVQGTLIHLLSTPPSSNKACPPRPPLLPQLPDGSEIPLPPILLGTLGSDPQKKTVCIYGHLDVQPAALEDGWDSEPFTLVERDGRDASPRKRTCGICLGGTPVASGLSFQSWLFVHDLEIGFWKPHACASILETSRSLPFFVEPGLWGLGPAGLPSPAADTFPGSPI